MIPFKRINYDHNEIQAVTEILETGMVGLGGKVFRFEQAFAEYLGCDHIVATDSCTSALFLSLEYENREMVGVPSMTVPLVANAVLESDTSLYFTDDIDWVGNAYPLLGTNVVDSAHEVRKRQLKGMDKATKYCYSFYPTKSIGSADGGAIATNDPKFADWARCKITYGRNQKQKYGNSWDYEVVMRGYKRHWTNLQAVVAHEQLKKLDKMNAKRQAIVDTYNTAFGYDNDSLYLYRVRVGQRDKFIAHMLKNGVQCGVHFKPLHLMEVFQDIPFSGDTEKVEDEYAHTISLPLFDLMTREQTELVIRLAEKHV